MMKNTLATAFLLSLIGVNLAAQAEMVAQPMPYETRLQRFVYDENRTYEILTRPMSATDIQFEQGEKFIGMPMGDTYNWEIGGLAGTNHLFIKPLFPRLVNTATLVTNKRTYQLVFKSSSEDGIWYQRVHWEFPDKQRGMKFVTPEQIYGNGSRAQLEENKPEPVRLNTEMSQNDVDGVKGPVDLVKGMDFDYEITGDASFKPVRVFNDKTRTWIEFPEDIQTYPAVFVKTGSELAVVSFTKSKDSNYFIVNRLFEECVLKYGEDTVSIMHKQKKKWWYE
jgi:type IV secretion system protein VirB9